ncbi:MAG TPA: hypothetical protein VHA33_11020 [Candidatus Angelobacter sp.]|jgi:hypothetical protein|nr:hypothetical protein [Candidatus Angelobacter sp.]
MPSKKPKNEPENSPKANLEAARKQLAIFFFQEKPNPWVNGVAIGFLRNSADAIIRAEKQKVAAQQAPELLVFVNPLAPKCVVDEVRTKAPTSMLVRTSRFVALAESGDSISPQDSSRYNVSPFSTGTLGCLVEAGGTTYILGSNHVVAHNGRVPDRANIVNPGLLEDPFGGPIVGSRSYFFEFQRPPRVIPPNPPGSPNPPISPNPPNTVDYAVAELKGNSTKRRASSLDPLAPLFSTAGQFDPKFLTDLSNTRIRKYGRTTPDTTSSVTIQQWQGPIDFTFGTYSLEQLLGVDTKEIFAAPGDSGALAFVDDPNARPEFKDRGVGLITARAYTLDASNRFVSYIILMCSLDLIAEDLAGQLNLKKAALKFYI